MPRRIYIFLTTLYFLLGLISSAKASFNPPALYTSHTPSKNSFAPLSDLCVFAVPRLPAAQGYNITNAYDAEGRRFSKKVNRYQSGQIVEQKHITFLHDGNDLIYERHQLPSGLTLLERKYIWGPDIAGGNAGGAGGLLLIREIKGNLTTDLYPLYDGTGHLIALTDIAGTLRAEFGYGPFGELIYAKGPNASSCPFRYATKYWDEETRLYNFGKRFFDPITGQWLSREPLGESESINLYSYCGNDPVNKVDVLGLFETQVQVDSLRMDLLLGQLMRDPNNLPASPPQEAIDILMPFPNAEKFGLANPYTPADYQRTQTHVQSIGNPTMSHLSWEDAERSRKHAFMPAPEWIPSTTSALTLGAANTPLNASINSDWLLPTGAGGAGLKFAFGGMKSLLPVLSAAVKIDGRAIVAELRAGDVSTSPWLADPRASIVSHIESFRGGGYYLVPQSTYEKWIKGKALVGRLDGQFITTRSAMDRVLSESGGNLAKVKVKLGIPDQFWNEPLVRIDVDSPLLLNARLPSGLQGGANEMFRWGGYTSGGLPEVIVNPIPARLFRATPTGIGP